MAHDPRPRVHPSLAMDLIGDVVEGQWCETCMLPAAAMWRMAVSDRRDPSRIWWCGQVYACRDCGRQWKVRDYGEPPPNVAFA